MVEQAVGSNYTQVVYGPLGNKLALMNGQTLVKAFVPLPGGATAVYNNSGFAYYRHSDWLGSSRLASTPGRAVYYDGAYAPFGESYAETGTTDRSFTGQNQDTVSGLDDFMFREYSASQQGRWISPDPAGLAAVDMTNPQSWNRYAYVGNNPLNFIDPLGLCDDVIAGITDTPGDAGSKGLENFANAQGADLAFPYTNSFFGGLGQVFVQGMGGNTAATTVALNSLKSALGDGSGPVNVFTFSGGAQALQNAYDQLSPAEQGRINNIVYISPGSGNPFPIVHGNGSTVILEATGADTFPLKSGGNAPIGGVTFVNVGDCKHDSNCMFLNHANLFTPYAGTRCNDRKTFSRGDRGTATDRGDTHDARRIQYMGWWGDYVNFSLNEVVTHQIY
jgi:RHS repeat-associated protein